MPEKRKPGRPRVLKGAQRVQLYLDGELYRIAVALGEGNASEGIRRALRAKAGAISGGDPVIVAHELADG